MVVYTRVIASLPAMVGIPSSLCTTLPTMVGIHLSSLCTPLYTPGYTTVHTRPSYYRVHCSTAAYVQTDNTLGSRRRNPVGGSLSAS